MDKSGIIRNLLKGMKALISLAEHGTPRRRGQVLFRNPRAILLTTPPEFLTMSNTVRIPVRGDTPFGHKLLGALFTDGAGEAVTPAPGQLAVTKENPSDACDVGILTDGNIWVKPANSNAEGTEIMLRASIDARTDVDDGFIILVVSPDVVSANLDGMVAEQLDAAPDLAA